MNAQEFGQKLFDDLCREEQQMKNLGMAHYVPGLRHAITHVIKALRDLREQQQPPSNPAGRL